MRQTGIVYVTTQAPPNLSDELMLAGFCVWEAMSESEVKHLCETEDIDAVVIAHDLAKRKTSAGGSGLICIFLEPTTTVQELVWELSLLFPQANRPRQ
jgi:hypothetical protein